MADLYDFQKDAVAHLLTGRHFIISGVGSGKTAMALTWAAEQCRQTGKHKVLVVTTASKVRTGDFEKEDKIWTDDSEKREMAVISWHKLKAWVEQNWKGLDEWVVIFDEAQRSKGYSTGMGKAFLKITKQNPDWAGFTGTPGDTWADYISYFVATNQTRNKTAYLHEFANVQTYKGYPEIVGWRNEDRLKAMWAHISYAPDTSIVAQQLPKEQYRTITLPKPRAYSKTLKTRLNEQGEFLDTAGAMVAELRRLCFTKDKQQWVADFVEGVESGVVMFYNYIATGDKLAEICEKALGKSGRVWRIDGKHHEIPTAETIGAKDVVLCQWQSGSEALNFQFLHYWVGVELCYSNSMLQQAMGRIRRIGQEHPMSFYRLLTDGTIEQDIAEALKNKKEFSEKVWCLGKGIIKEEE